MIIIYDITLVWYVAYLMAISNGQITMGLRHANEIFESELQPLQRAFRFAGGIHGLNKQEPIMSGQFCCHSFPGGLSMHATKAIERQDLVNATELPPGLSFNFVFKGEIEFTFGNSRYRMSDQPRVKCTAIVNSSHELMSRLSCKDMQVHKLNIFVEKSWLERRCGSIEDEKRLESLFASRSVYSWVPSARTLAKARFLLNVEQSTCFEQKLQTEYLTINLLAECIEQLHRARPEEQSESGTHFQSDSALKFHIRQLTQEYHTVGDIAAALNMSERTLQRKFQANYHCSASTYIKQCKLERAKTALVFEGKSIGETAYMVGYRHANNFMIAFKKQFGMTPLEFVKLHRGARHNPMEFNGTLNAKNSV